MARTGSIRRMMAAAVVAVAVTVPASAEAAGEAVTYGITMAPQHGKLFREAPRAVDWSISAAITAPWPASPTILPIKQIVARFPPEMSFNPPDSMPVCPDSILGPGVNPSLPVDEVVALCPRAVIGNGVSSIYIGRVNGPDGPNLTDPEMVMFNGGRNSRGRPVIKTYGFSKGVNAGIYMVGTLERNGEYRVSMPVLPFDSAVGAFTLSIPGTTDPHPNRRGLEPGYVMATCSRGSWMASAQFTLGTRDNAGRPIGPDSIVVGPDLTIPCEGARGRARFGRIRVTGPRRIRSGRAARFRVSIPSIGTASARSVRVRAMGRGIRGRAAVARIRPGVTRTLAIRVKARRSGDRRVVFRVGAAGVARRATVRLRVG